MQQKEVLAGYLQCSENRFPRDAISPIAHAEGDAPPVWSDASRAASRCN
jgi:hypothetical protein